jgi:hypothetical protein
VTAELSKFPSEMNSRPWNSGMLSLYLSS